MRRSSLRPKRPTPRRSEGRIKHDRMRPKASRPPTAEQQRYHLWLRGLTKCEACWKRGTAIHHLLARVPGKQGRRDHWYVVLLCDFCHNGSEKSVHGLGSEAKFLSVHGVDLCAISVQRLQEWRNDLA